MSASPILNTAQPRVPNTDRSGRIAIYKNLFRMISEQPAAATNGAAIALGFAAQDLRLDDGDLVAVINQTLAAAETITIDVTVQRPLDAAPFSILTAPVVLNAATVKGTRVRLPINPLVFDGLLPQGTIVRTQRTVANPATSPANVIGAYPYPSA